MPSTIPFLPTVLLLLALLPSTLAAPPTIVTTWSSPFLAATEAAYTTLLSTQCPISAVESGCSHCETHRCDRTVGYGGSPDEECETTLDAMIMVSSPRGYHNVGAVAGLRRVKHAVSVARAVLDRTQHSLLVGDQATAFAVQNGFREETLGTGESRAVCQAWREGGCQPNFREEGWFTPDPGSGCGPYTASRNGRRLLGGHHGGREARSVPGHDTISLLALSGGGDMAAGTSSNGASHKIPGRVGDAPIPGSGAYVDGEVGACGATGDGDIMMRFLPCYQAVENLRLGMTPTKAAEDVVGRMLRRFPDVHSGIVVLDKHGRHGAAASGWNFTYSFRTEGMDAAEVVVVPSLSALSTGSLHVQP